MLNCIHLHHHFATVRAFYRRHQCGDGQQWRFGADLKPKSRPECPGTTSARGGKPISHTKPAFTAGLCASSACFSLTREHFCMPRGYGERGSDGSATLLSCLVIADTASRAYQAATRSSGGTMTVSTTTVDRPWIGAYSDRAGTGPALIIVCK
jgi:hypothetical protein